jgi:photosynthetic reaction center H subunit
MNEAIIVGRLDVAELVFYAFVLFFIALVFYLRREDRQEGYPLEHLVTGQVDSALGPLSSTYRKRFRLPFDRGYATTPTKGREPVEFAARRFERYPGAPYVPTGNPLLDGVGPAAFADRAKWPDLDFEGNLRIVPIGTDPHFTIAGRDPKLIGMTMTSADHKPVGKIVDVWIDRSDRMIRYVDVALASGRTVTVPMGFVTVKARKGIVHCDSLGAGLFEAVPALAKAGEITRYEEERLMGYFGGGYLYGLPGREEPLI